MEAERRMGRYKECMRNHAARLGTYAADGCCEFIPDGAGLGRALHCGACGCHRNFHRKEDDDYSCAGIDRKLRKRRRRRRQRTKFSAEQKARMLRFAEGIGWRIPPRSDGVAVGDDEVARFCREIGVSRQVFKVWMHNHKHSNAGAAAPALLEDGGGGGEEEEEVKEGVLLLAEPMEEIK